MRQLIWVPILHTAAELGSAAAVAERLHGGQGWQALQERLDAGWKEAISQIEAMGLDWRKTRIYQDSLPAGGHQGRIVVADLASRGSQNHQLLLHLLDQGAVLEGTEDLSLLVQEIELLRRNTGPDAGKKAQSLLEQRDRYIAGRISATLQNGETGLLFLGALHNIQPWLAADIRMTRLEVRWGHRESAM